MRWLAVIALLISAGCAEKKPVKPSARLSTKPGVHIEFRGIKDGRCVIGDVFLDAQTGGYIVVCK